MYVDFERYISSSVIKHGSRKPSYSVHMTNAVYSWTSRRSQHFLYNTSRLICGLQVLTSRTKPFVNKSAVHVLKSKIVSAITRSICPGALCTNNVGGYLTDYLVRQSTPGLGDCPTNTLNYFCHCKLFFWREMQLQRFAFRLSTSDSLLLAGWEIEVGTL